MYNKVKVLGRVNEAFAGRGWRDSGNEILRISEQLSQGVSTQEVVRVISGKFLLANSIKRQDIVPVLDRVLREKDILQIDASSPTRLLFAYSTPLNVSPLRLGTEEKQIKEALRAITDRDKIHIDTIPAVELKDFSNAFNRYRPNILHISSHGNQDHIALENEKGQAITVDGDMLINIVKLAGKQLKIVVLNACESSKMAASLTDVVDVTIGMNMSIGDNAARAFAVQLYSSIGENIPIGLAFEQAKFAISANGISEADTPVLHYRKGIHPEKYQL
ncbi:MAG: CHAT domain-containing protein [Candidatus Saccharimonas sp.]|nr:MAG: CHAT domain-containing protein [Candidatus Saccharimonas sp.]